MANAKDPLLKRFHRLCKQDNVQFQRGMSSDDGPQKRALWLDVLTQLRRVQTSAAGGLQHAAAEQTLLTDVRASIVDAVEFLISGENADNKELTTKQLRVWSSHQNARLAIVQEAIALAHSRRDAPLVHHDKPPLIILISDRPEESFEQRFETCRRSFLDSWSSTCYGVGEVVTIQAESSEKVREAVEHLFEGFSESDMFPVLMVIHASEVTNITSDIMHIKAICEEWNVRLCVEGPALAMLAQSNRPSDPEECANAADVLLLDPASWFGFRMCAIVTWHELVKTPVLREFKDHYSRLLANSTLLKDHDEIHGLATAPILNLWTVLTKVGLQTIRDSIDAVTVLAETLISNLRDSPNIITVYEGVGCIVRISYALSKEDRLLPKEKSQEHVSLVNNIIFASLREESEALCIQQSISSESACLHFAPTRLLSSGTLWIPPVDMLNDYSKLLQDTVDKYESCRAASVAFQSCVAKCREIRFVQDMSEQPERYLAFGAFRIVPVEMGDTWDGNDTSVEIVEGLTTLVAKELTESPHDISAPKHVVQEETEIARALAEQLSRNTRRLRPSFLSNPFGRRWSFPHGYGGDGPLPFDVFLHSDSESSFHDFISIEPRDKCKPIDAVNQAAIASDLMIACVTKIMGQWRAGEITFPLEDDDVDESVAKNAEDIDENDIHIGAMDATEEEALEDQVVEQTSDHADFDNAHPAPGSEASYPPLNSLEERGAESSQEYDPEVESSNFEGSPSASSGEYEHELPSSPQTMCQDQLAKLKHATEKREFRIKDVLSVSTIEKSSRGTRTDEEAIPSDYMLPTGSSALYPASSGDASKASEPVSSVETVPEVHAATGRSWFGSWRTRGWRSQYENSDDESASSTSYGESSDGAEYNSGNQNDATNEDDEDSQESDSTSSDETPSDRDSNDEWDETSEDTARDDIEEDEDSVIDGSSSESTEESDEHPVSTEKRKEGSKSSQPSRASRLLAWIRSGKAQQQLQKPKRSANNPSPYQSDSEVTLTSSHSDLEEGETQDIHKSEEEESFSGERSQTLSSGQQGDEDTSEESDEGSITGTESYETEGTSDSSDSERKVNQRTGKGPGTGMYLLSWFNRAGEPAKSTSTRATRKVRDSDSESCSSTETESASQESSATYNTSRESSKRRQQDYESRRNSEWSETTESNRNSSEDEISYDEISESDDSRRGVRRSKTRRRESTESSSSESSSQSENEGRSKYKTRSGLSFLDWALPSWATTPPKLGKRKAPMRGVNSRLRASISSQTSTETESDDSYERKTRRSLGKRRSSSTVRSGSQRRNSSSDRNRHRRTRT